jgi:hypothetical protein
LKGPLNPPAVGPGGAGWCVCDSPCPLSMCRVPSRMGLPTRRPLEEVGPQRRLTAATA